MTLRERVENFIIEEGELNRMVYRLTGKLAHHGHPSFQSTWFFSQFGIQSSHHAQLIFDADEDILCFSVPWALLANPTNEAVSAFIASERLAEGGEK